MILISQALKKLELDIKMKLRLTYNFITEDLCFVKLSKVHTTMNKNVIYKTNLLKEIFLNFSWIISNIKQSERYIMDISTLPVPLDRSTLPSQKGLRQLEITKF